MTSKTIFFINYVFWRKNAITFFKKKLFAQKVTHEVVFKVLGDIHWKLLLKL